MYTVATFYKFTDLDHYRALHPQFKEFCTTQNLIGTLLLASEGINGTLAGRPDAIQALYRFLTQYHKFADLSFKTSVAQTQPFYRLKVRLKKELVPITKKNGQQKTCQGKKVGTYLSPNQWNLLLEDKNLILIDTRNDYEIRLGTFKGALNPQTKTFREFPQFVQKELTPHKKKKIALFCTGGIRCEKSTSYLLDQGFEQVYHLKGGILKYLEETPKEHSKWQGECFVFDRRVTVTHELVEGNASLCYGCRMPLTNAEKKTSTYETGVRCTHCYQNRTPKQIAKARERHHQQTLAKRQETKHLGQVMHK